MASRVISQRGNISVSVGKKRVPTRQTSTVVYNSASKKRSSGRSSTSSSKPEEVPETLAQQVARITGKTVTVTKTYGGGTSQTDKTGKKLSGSRLERYRVTPNGKKVFVSRSKTTTRYVKGSPLEKREMEIQEAKKRRQLPTRAVVIQDKTGRVIKSNLPQNIVGKKLSQSQVERLTRFYSGKTIAGQERNIQAQQTKAYRDVFYTQKRAEERIQRKIENGERVTALDLIESVTGKRSLDLTPSNTRALKSKATQILSNVATMDEYFRAKKLYEQDIEAYKQAERQFIQQEKEAKRISSTSTPIIEEAPRYVGLFGRLLEKPLPPTFEGTLIKSVKLMDGGSKVGLPIVKSTVDVLSSLSNLYVNRNQKNIVKFIKTMKDLKNATGKAVKFAKDNEKLAKTIVKFFVKEYIAKAKYTYLTKESWQRIARLIASPFIGAGYSIADVVVSKELIKINRLVNDIYSVYKPKNQKEIQLKNRIIDLLYKASDKKKQYSKKYRGDVLNAIIAEVIILTVVYGKGIPVIGKAVAKVAGVGVKVVSTLEYVKLIVNPSPENVSDVLDWGFIDSIRAKTLGNVKSVGKFIKENPKVLKGFNDVIFKSIKVLGKAYNKVRVDTLPYKTLFKGMLPKPILNVIQTTTKGINAINYGSIIEQRYAFESARDFLQKLTGKKYSDDMVLKELEIINRDNKLTPELKNLIQNPKDLDLVIKEKDIKPFIKRLDNEYRYLPEMLIEFAKANKWNKNIDLTFSKFKSNKNSVFSRLSEEQITAILKGLTKNPVVTAFKVLLLERIYGLKTPEAFRFIKNAELKDSGLSLKGSEFAIDLHSDDEVAVTKKLFGFINRKQYLPLELSKKENFKKLIIENEKAMQKVESAKELFLNKLADKFQKEFSKYDGFKLNKKKFKEIYPKFLEKSEIRDPKGFDFLVDGGKIQDVNKKVLKTYYEFLDFFALTTPYKLTTLKQAGNRAKISLLIQNMLKFSKSASKGLNKFDSELAKLEQDKANALYYAGKSKQAIYKGLRFNDKSFKLKEKLTEAEANKLVENIAKYEKEINKYFSRERVQEYIRKFVDKIDLGKPKGYEYFDAIDINVKGKGLTSYQKKELIKYKPKTKKEFEVTKDFLGEDETISRQQVIINKFKTEGLYLDSEGNWRLRIGEQLKRRGLGAISSPVEARRVKDVEKLYGQLKLQEGLALKLKDSFKKATIVGKIKLLAKFKTKILFLNRNINKFRKLSKSLKLDSLRKELIFRTKGQSELVRIGNVEISNLGNKAIQDKTTKQLGYTKSELKRIESTTKKYLDNEISKKQLDKVTNDITTRKVKAEAKKVGLKKSIDKITGKTNALVLAKAVRSLVRAKYKAKSSISLSKIKSLSRSKSVSLIASKSASKSVSKSTSVSRSASKSVSKSLSKSTSVSRSASKSVSTSKSASASKSASKSKSQSKSKSASKSVSKSINRIIDPIKINLPRFRFNSKLPKGYVRVVRVVVKSKGTIRTLRKKFTENKGLLFARKLIDNTTARSFKLKLVGIAKAKDIKMPKLIKFRKKMSSNGKVLDIVEKTRYAIDTKGEKSGLSVAKYLKRTKIIKRVKKKKRNTSSKRKVKRKK